MSAEETAVNNSPFSDEELEHFKKKLNQEMEEVQEKIENLNERLDSLMQNSDDTQSSQDDHQADLGTDEQTREKLLIELEKQRDKRAQVKVALDRIATGNYGICIESGEPIQKERLEQIPYAIRSVKVKD